jgi:hypothetical protein
MSENTSPACTDGGGISVNDPDDDQLDAAGSKQLDAIGVQDASSPPLEALRSEHGRYAVVLQNE